MFSRAMVAPVITRQDGKARIEKQIMVSFSEKDE